MVQTTELSGRGQSGTLGTAVAHAGRRTCGSPVMTHCHVESRAGLARAEPRSRVIWPPGRCALRAGVRWLAVASVVVLGPAAWAQQAPKSVGDLLDRGGSRVAAQDMRSLVTGASVSGNGLGGGPFILRLAADGRVNGVAGFARVEVNGTWEVDDKGQLCLKVSWSSGAESRSRCFPWFKLGEQYFESPLADHGSALMPRIVSR